MFGQVKLLSIVLTITLPGAGCALSRPSSPATPPPPTAAHAPAVTAPLPPDEDERLPWGAEEEYFVVIRKRCGLLRVYHFGRLVRTYEAVFGRNQFGSKLYQGDMRTPSGLYMIVDKRRHSRWERFLLLDYPNLTDLRAYTRAVESGDLPEIEGAYPGIGGAVGIHGTDREALNGEGVNWTFGCISLDNSDVRELAQLVPVGTLVLIEN